SFEQRDRRSHRAAGDQYTGAGRYRPLAAGIFPSSAAKGDPGRTRRGKRAVRRDRAVSRQDTQSEDAGNNRGRGASTAKETRANAPRHGRNGDTAKLAGYYDGSSVVRSVAGQSESEKGRED